MRRLVIFDFDGTLGDTCANIIRTMQDTFRVLSYPVAGEEAIRATIGPPLEEGFRVLLPEVSEEAILTCARVYREIFEENRKVLVPKLFPHVRETLQALQDQGITMSVASSRRSLSLNGFLHDMDIARYISYVIGADGVEKAKPDPEPVLKTLQETGFEARESLVVGDMPVDILMGKRAGVRTCGVTYGNASRAELQAAGADFIIDDILEILDLVCR